MIKTWDVVKNIHLYKFMYYDFLGVQESAYTVYLYPTVYTCTEL